MIFLMIFQELERQRQEAAERERREREEAAEMKRAKQDQVWMLSFAKIGPCSDKPIRRNASIRREPI